MKFFITMSTGVCGSDGYDTFEANDLLEAEDIGYEMAIEHAQAYFDVIFDESEEFDEEEYAWGSDYILESDVNFYVEEYNPEDHDKYLY